MEFNKSEGICEINSIYVPESDRRRGFGTELLKAAERFSTENGILGMHADYTADEELSAFFDANRYMVVDGDEICEVSTDAFFESEVLKRVLKSKKEKMVFPYGMLTSSQNAMVKKLFLRGGYDAAIAKEVFSNPVLSQVCFDNTKKPDGVLLISGYDERLMIALLLTATGDNTAQIRTLFTAFLDACKKTERNEKSISFYAANQKIRALVEKIVTDKSAITNRVLTQIAVKSIGEFDG